MNKMKHAYKPKHAKKESIDKLDTDLIYIHIINMLLKRISDIE